MENIDFLSCFSDISSQVLAGTLSASDASNILASHDITSLTFDEMEQIEDCDWLTDDIYVTLIRRWLTFQEQKLSKIRSYLILNKVIGKETLLKFIDFILNQKNEFDYDIERIFYLLATGGGANDFLNLVTSGILKVTSNCAMDVQTFHISNLFSNDPKKYFQSKPVQNANLMIELPAFLKISLRSYVLQGPPKNGAPKSWILQGSNDKEKWIDIDTRILDNELAEPGAEHTYVLAKKTMGFRYFLLTQKDFNHVKNYSLILSSIDFNGELILEPLD